MKVLKDVDKNVKQKALPLLTSVTMAATMFAGTGITAFAGGFAPIDGATVNYATGGGTEVDNPEKVVTIDSGAEGLTIYSADDYYLKVATKEGYSFSSYTADKAVSKSVDGGTEGDVIDVGDDLTPGTKYYFAEDTALTPAWEADKFYVTVNINEDSEDIAKTYEKDWTASDIVVPKIDGYTFLGWDTNGITTTVEADDLSELSAAVDGMHVLNPDSDISVTAVFAENTYTITYLTNDGKGASQEPDEGLAYDDSISAFTETVKEGYSFKGWSKTSGGSIVDVEDGAAIKDMSVEWVDGNPANEKTLTLYEIIAADSYTIKYDSNGGEGTIEDQDYTPDDASVTLDAGTAFTREGYTLYGWSTSKSRTVKGFEAGNGTDYDLNDSTYFNPKTGKDVTLYAVWEPHTSTITFDRNTGDGPAATLPYTYGKSLTIPAELFTAYTKTGYTFKGFAETSSGDVVYTASENVIAADEYPAVGGTVTLYAIYEAGSVKVIFDANADDATGTMADQVLEAGTAGKLTKNTFVRTGYTFSGWNTSEDGKGTSYIDGDSITTNVSLTLYAQWTEHEYEIDFDSNGGQGTMAIMQKIGYDNEVTLNENTYTYNGYEFAGWSTKNNAKTAEFKDKATVSKLSAADKGVVTLYAVWNKISTYTITYDANGGTGTIATARDQELPYTTDSGSNFNRPNYILIGWSTDANATTIEYGRQDDITESTTSTIDLYAVWRGVIHTVDFDPNGGEGSMDTQIFEYGKEIPLNANEFDYEGHVFKGWSTSPTGDVEFEDKDIIDKITNDIVLYAVWEDVDTDNTEAAEIATDEANTAAEKAIEAKGAAEKAAAAAEANPTAETVAAAKSAASAAEKAAAAAEAAAAKAFEAANAKNVDSIVKALAEEASKSAQTAADDANTAAKAASDAANAAQAIIDKKASDGSSENTPAPVGNELKDANGNATGFVVTDATASAPTVEYKGTDADKKATKLVVPATVKDHSGNTYTVTSIAPSAFAKDTSLKNLTIPNTVVKIGKNAFKNCKNLKKVTIKANANLKVGKNAFKGMKKDSKIVVKGVKGAKKTKLVNKVKKQVTSSKTTVK